MSGDRCELLCIDFEEAERLRASRAPAETVTRAAARARALGDATRLGLALALADADELCVCDLAWVVGRAQNLVSHHLRALRAQGLVSYRRDGKMVLYSLTLAGRALVDATMAGAEAGRR